MKRREGFTLAEMVIVMAITAIFAATAIHVTGDALEAARNRDRETRFTTALNDAYLKALAQSRTLSEGDSVEAYLSDLSSELAEAVLQDLNAFSKSSDASAALNISYGTASFSIDAAPLSGAKETGVKFAFELDGNKVPQLASVWFIANNYVVFPEEDA